MHHVSAAELIALPEGKTLELKRDASSPKNLMKTLVAFANSAGGTLVIGVEDSTRAVVGVENGLDEEERLCNLIADSIEPRLVPNIELLAAGDKTLLAVKVYPSGTRPHWLKREGPQNGVFVRLGSTNRLADEALIGELRRGALGIGFDEQPVQEGSPEDLDFAAAAKAFEGHRTLGEKDLESIRLVTRSQGRLVPTFGGILLFGRKREEQFPDAWIQCGRFAGKDKSVIVDHIDIHDHLPIAVERGLEFLKKHALRGADLSELKRKDTWSIPLVILREALVNAIVHADYSQRGSPFRIAFFDDRIEIESPGIFPPGITFEDMLQGVSKVRNHVIARVFREIGLIEQWGSGVPRMVDEAKKLGLPEPEIIEIGMRVRCIIRFAKVLVASATKPSGAESWAESGAESEVLDAIGNGALSVQELASKLGRSTVTGALKRTVRALLNTGLLERTLPEKPNSRLQKYRRVK